MGRSYRNPTEYVRVCPADDKVFRTFDIRKVYCSPACKQAAYRLRKKRAAARRARKSS